MLCQQLIFQNLAGLATPGHCIDIQIRERLLRPGRLIAIREHLLLIIKDGLQEIILNVSPPQRLSIILLQVLNLIPRINRRICARRHSRLFAFPRALWFSRRRDRRAYILVFGHHVVASL